MKLWLLNPEVRERYEAGESGARLAAECHVSQKTLYRALHGNGVNVRKTGPNPNTNRERDAEIAALCSSMTMKEIGERYNLTPERVRQIAKRAGITVKRGWIKHSAWDSADKIVERYSGGESASRIATEYECNAKMLVNILKANGVKIRKRYAEPRHQEMIRLRKEGLTFREIGEQVGCRGTYVWQIIDRAKKEGTYQEAAE